MVAVVDGLVRTPLVAANVNVARPPNPAAGVNENDPSALAVRVPAPAGDGALSRITVSGPVTASGLVAPASRPGAGIVSVWLPATLYACGATAVTGRT
jgi:hypothetical protein